MTFLIDGQKVRLSPKERDVFAALFNAKGAKLPIPALIDALYGDDEDGGPETAGHCISCVLGRLKRKLAATRFRLANQRSTRSRASADTYVNGYHLERLPAANG